jgi:uncharacterized lipoprotein YmbA
MFLGMAALASCGSPVVSQYRLAAVPGAVRNAGRLNMAVRGILIPGYLDQNNIIRPGGAYQVNSFANAAWAAPLAAMLQAELVADLAQRLPAATIFADGAIGTPADVTIEADIQRFDFDPDGSLNLTAQLALKSATANGWTARKFQASAQVPGVDATAVVAAMSILWGQLADQVADLVG